MSGPRDRRETDRAPAESGGKCPKCGTTRELRRYNDATSANPQRVSVRIECPGCGAEETHYI
ncbi:hypothetical protein ACFVSK_02355 [Cellulosimicrobium cellulans]|uniref:hypothetical protein n=1 Tax=Cellulosimicrobium cellulans TaxID=1710 RepID=UPI0036EB5FA5